MNSDLVNDLTYDQLSKWEDHLSQEIQVHRVQPDDENQASRCMKQSYDQALTQRLITLQAEMARVVVDKGRFAFHQYFSNRIFQKLIFSDLMNVAFYHNADDDTLDARDDDYDISMENIREYCKLCQNIKLFV